MTSVREVREEDIPAVRELFEVAYEGEYPHRQFLDDHWLKRSVFNDDILMLVAEDAGRVLGTASVVLDIGAHSDLIGEFGRLAVHPDGRGRGIGKLLMQHRVEYVSPRLHVGLVENRAVHDFSQRISHAHAFAPVGFLPQKHLFRNRESIALFARHFGAALALRCNHPRVVPEVQPLAHLSLNNCGLPCDVIVDEDSHAYPPEGEFVLEELGEEVLPDLMRIERGRVRQREIFGPMRLQYGFFKLTKKSATYLVARRRSGDETSSIAGAIGYTLDETERNVRVFELIVQSEHAIRFLLDRLMERCRDEWNAHYVEVDVQANAPRMQRTLLELGFLPVAYVPAKVFHDVERFDVVTMAHLFAPLELGELRLTPPMQAYADQVLKAFRRQEVLPRIAKAVEHLALFQGLSNEQRRRLACTATVGHYAPDAALFTEGATADRIHVIVEGGADVRVAGQLVGSVGPGESLGELALLTGEPHSAEALAKDLTVTAELARSDLEELTRRRPDIGVQLYRQLAVSLGRKLQRVDSTFAGVDELTG